MNTLLNSALTLTYNQLSTFSGLNNFWQVFDTAFGTQYNRSGAEILRLQWQSGDFSQLPQIDILDNSTLGNANGAYASSNNKIYLSANFIATSTPEAISAVLLEEIGHFIDAQINQIDTLGDEGEKFSALVRGQNLTTQELDRINTENDWANITVDGKIIAVEQAAPIVLTVDTTVDQNDGSATNGLSLRDAILIANADITNDYIIELQGGQTYSLSIKNTASLNDGGDEQAAVRGDLDILAGGKITIKSVGTQKAIIDATNLKTSFASGFGDSAIDVKNNAYLILDGVTVTGASVGAVWIGTNGTAEISNSLITNNEITSASAGNNVTNKNGSGIKNYGTLLLKDSTISNNKAAGNGGGIFNAGRTTITNTTISGNMSDPYSNGGGIFNAEMAIATITNTAIIDNRSRFGGGINNYGTVSITNTTISGNTTNQSGGGIFNRSDVATSSTVKAKIYLNNSTITNNTADLDSNNDGIGGGISNVSGYGEVYAKNTIIAGNFDTPNNSGRGSGVTYYPDISGPINGNNYNLIGNTTRSSGTIGTGTDIVNSNILLGTLQNNGGSTKTHALLDGSLAINAGNNSLISLDTNDIDGDGNTTETIPFDQRGTGFYRIANNRVDIGAFESQGIATPVITINNISVVEGNSGTKTGTVTVTLNAVTDKTVTVDYTTANNNAIAGNDYTAMSGQLSFAPGETTKTINVNILGDNIAEVNESFFVNLSNPTNAIIDPNAGPGIVTITDDEPNPAITLTVNTTTDQNDGTATNGLSLRDAILIANSDITNDYVIELQGGQTYSLSIKNTASLNNGGNEQAAVRGDLDILAGGKITIKSVGAQKAIIDATNLKTSFVSGFGDSAIDVQQNAYLILDGVTVTGASVGAVWIGTNSTAEISNSLITNNEITVASAFYEGNQDGSGITNYGTLLLKDSTISNNKAARYGGGIYNNDTATAIINNTTISGNTADKTGGGIFNFGTATITNSTISSNKTNESGGGIVNTGTATITNTTISGNTANQDGGGIFSSKPNSAAVTGKIYLNNSTITNNTADLDSNNTGSGGGITNVSGAGEVYAENTIIAGNFDTPNNSGGGSGITYTYNPDISGSINGNNYNLIGNKTGASGTIGTGTDLVKPNILLGLLQNNGGSTQTHVLLNGSPAIDAGNNSLIPLDTNDVDGDGNTTESISFDQRGTGFSRIANNGVDIGAFESQGIAPPVITINNISVIEGNSGTKTGTVTVKLNAVTDKTVTVDYTTANNNAIAGIDYTATSGQLSFAPGETTKTFNVNILGNNIAEANESFFVNLSNATNAIIDPNAGPGIVTITDDEPHPIILAGNSLPNPAITLTVNTTADQNDGSATGGLSLRDAILIANSDIANQYIINLTGGTTYSLTAFSLTDTKGGDLDILGNVTIQSTGTQPATIDASGLTNADRVFEVFNYLNLSNIVVKGGATTDTGGGIYIRGNATAKLFNTTVKNNSSYYGGGIYNSGEIWLVNSTVSDNKATDARISTNNNAGGGIYNSGQAILLGTTIKNNTAKLLGGGIYNSGTSIISTSTIYNNKCGNSYLDGAGGGIDQDSGTVSLINSTLSGNEGGGAGGIFARGGVLNVVNSTITNNTSPYYFLYENRYKSTPGTGGISSRDATVNLKNTIVAGNFGESDYDGDYGNPDIYGYVNGNNNNLIGNKRGASGTVGTGTDIVNPNPKLGPLQDNGNGIFTHALLSGSPAINKGNNALVLTDVFDIDFDGNNTETIPFDNRGSGFTRISSGTVDIGAFEFQPAPNLNLSINDVTLTEGNSGTKNATFTVTLSGETFQPVTVNYATANGTATAGSDYTATTGTLIFNVNPGETSKQITVSVLGDSLFEANETFFVNLSNAINANIADTQGQGTINNDDVALPTITLAVSPTSVSEDGTTNLIYTFTRTGSTTNALTVNYGITGTANTSDYTGATPGTGKTITFAANSATATLTIDPTADTIVESNETVALTLATGTDYTIGTTTAVIGTITNDDLLPNLNLSANKTIVEGNTNPQNVTYTVTLTSASSQSITVQYATANGTAIAASDYTSTSGTLTFNPGVTSQVINIPILNDSLNEANETFSLTLNSPTNASLGTSQTVTTTISDTLSAAATTTLRTNVENLTLTGTAAINGTGNAGNNVITGNSANNTLSGLNGNDTYSLVANSALGTDTITETATVGTDTIDFTGTTAAVNVNLGVTTSQTVNSNLKLILSANNVIENATGGTGNNRLTGNTLNNILSGGDGNDQLQGLGGDDNLWGGVGNDILDGGTGNDSLWGGLGDDVLTGGVGNDQYLFQSSSVFATSLGIDYISNFEAGLDQIVLSKITFNAITNLAGQALTDFAVVTDDEFVNASNARIVFSQNTGSLFYNQDGNLLGATAVFEFARLSNPDITLSSSNFSLIA